MNLTDLKNLDRKLFKLRQSVQTPGMVGGEKPEELEIKQRIEKLWLDVHDLRERRRLADAEKKDKGELLFTVFSPIICGKDAGRYVAGLRETRHTGLRSAVLWHWKRGGELDHTAAAWRPIADSRFFGWEYDFRNLMSAERLEPAA